MNEATNLSRLSSKIEKVRAVLKATESERDDLIRSSTLRPAEIAKATGLSAGRISQIQSR